MGMSMFFNICGSRVKSDMRTLALSGLFTVVLPAFKFGKNQLISLVTETSVQPD